MEVDQNHDKPLNAHHDDSCGDSSVSAGDRSVVRSTCRPSTKLYAAKLRISPKIIMTIPIWVKKKGAWAEWVTPEENAVEWITTCPPHRLMDSVRQETIREKGGNGGLTDLR